MRIGDIGDSVLDDVLLPSDAQRPHAKEASGPLGFLNEARFAIAFGAMGAAHDFLEATLDYATTRVQFDLPIAGFQLTQAKLADMMVEYHKGSAAGVAPRPTQGCGLHPARADKPRQAPQRSGGIGDSAHLPYDSRWLGHHAELPVLRHANNLESVLTYEGTAEVHQLAIGAALTGLPAYR